MKKIFTLAAVATLFASSYVYGQGMRNNGASINMTGGVTMYISGSTGNYTNENGGKITAGASGNIKLDGNWINNALNAVFTSNNGTVSMLGGSETLGGTNSTSFNNLVLAGTGTKTLASNILVGGGFSSPAGILNINDRPLDLNGHTLTISNPIEGNSSNGAIQFTSGYIISEQDASVNNSIITWQMGGVSNMGNHIFPFGTAAGVQVPVTFTIGSTANTNVSVSTRRTIDNTSAPNPAGSSNQPYASGVTNMNDATGTDISVSSIIDRWWQFDVTAPTVADLNLTYQGVENTTVNPTSDFDAQEWNGSAWVGPLGGGLGVTTGTGSVFVPGVNAFGPMVLVESVDQLPLTVVSFESSCLTSGALLSWTTATELNTNYFTVERSFDGQNFTAIGQIKAAGNSSSVKNYSYSDSTTYSTAAYYRLTETDMNGNKKMFQSITADCHASVIAPLALAIYPNPNQGNYVNVHLSGLQSNSPVQVRVIDMFGRQVMATTNVISDENGSLATMLNLNNALPKGIYNVAIQTGDGKQTTKSFVIQ